ncbi:MAG: glycosyltransferase family 4 protein [Deltaproteobacteria bacterium]|nr:glycosyltransferase family 4 protein [Deltaproteobacteria bacterium]
MMKRETPGHSEVRISGNGRVLWITERFPPSVGGMAVSCGRMVRGLRALDVHLDVLLLSGEPFREGIAATDRDGGVDYTLRAGGAPGHSAQLGWSLVRRRHAVTPYTFVVGFGANFPGFLAVSYASWLELPSLVLVRGNDLDRDWFEARRGHWVREALSRAGVVGAVSREMVERVLALFPEKDVRFLPNGVDVSEWELLPADRARREEIRKRLGENGRRVVGLFGELKFKKRVTLWLRALRDSGLSERVGLLVVGRIDEETRQILDDPVLVPLHLHVPFCERGDLAGLYAACDYVVIPSLFDGMPNALLEGMVSGALPIVSDAGGMKDVVVHGETGFLFRAEDGEAAARVTVEALSLTDEELSTIAARAKARVIRDFSTDRERARLLEILFPGENGRAGKRS